MKLCGINGSVLQRVWSRYFRWRHFLKNGTPTTPCGPRGGITTIRSSMQPVDSFHEDVVTLAIAAWPPAASTTLSEVAGTADDDDLRKVREYPRGTFARSFADAVTLYRTFPFRGKGRRTGCVWNLLVEGWSLGLDIIGGDKLSMSRALTSTLPVRIAGLWCSLPTSSTVPTRSSQRLPQDFCSSEQSVMRRSDVWPRVEVRASHAFQRNLFLRRGLDPKAQLGWVQLWNAGWQLSWQRRRLSSRSAARIVKNVISWRRLRYPREVRGGDDPLASLLHATFEELAPVLLLVTTERTSDASRSDNDCPLRLCKWAPV